MQSGLSIRMLIKHSREILVELHKGILRYHIPLYIPTEQEIFKASELFLTLKPDEQTGVERSSQHERRPYIALHTQTYHQQQSKQFLFQSSCPDRNVW